MLFAFYRYFLNDSILCEGIILYFFMLAQLLHYFPLPRDGLLPQNLPFSTMKKNFEGASVSMFSPSAKLWKLTLHYFKIYQQSVTFQFLETTSGLTVEVWPSTVILEKLFTSVYVVQPENLRYKHNKLYIIVGLMADLILLKETPLASIYFFSL